MLSREKCGEHFMKFDVHGQLDFAAPEAIADSVWFLLRSEYITGEVLRVDGGIAI